MRCGVSLYCLNNVCVRPQPVRFTPLIDIVGNKGTPRRETIKSYRGSDNVANTGPLATWLPSAKPDQSRDQLNND